MKVTTDGCLFGAWCAADIRKMVKEGNLASSSKVLDIGTGTGLLSLMLAQKAALQIDAVEIDAAAAGQAAGNVATSPFSGQITVMKNDVLQLQEPGYGVIFSNPPFYENELKSGNHAKDTAHHSHQLTWAELFAAINRMLNDHGVFFLLLPAKREGELEGYLKKEDLYVNRIVRVQQTTRHTPFRLLVQGSRTVSPVSEERLSIKDENQQYTPEFTALLKDYYLYL